MLILFAESPEELEREADEELAEEKLRVNEDPLLKEFYETEAA